MTAPEQIEAAFKALAATVTGVATSEDHEPERLRKRPAVTMLYLRYTIAPDAEREIGPQLEVGWEWRVFVYVDLQNGKWKTSQKTCRDLVSRLVVLPRQSRHLDLAGVGATCTSWTLNDEGDEPDLGERRPGLLVKTLRLTAWTYENDGP